MNKNILMVTITVAWWFRFYAWALFKFCEINATQPDVGKLLRVLEKATRITTCKNVPNY